jgi:hypothetical protein
VETAQQTQLTVAVELVVWDITPVEEAETQVARVSPVAVEVAVVHL